MLEALVLGCSFILSTAVALLWWIRPFPIDKDLPGPKRTKLFGIFDMMSSDGEDSAILAAGWDQWPTLGLMMARRSGFRTWGAPTPNIGFGGAFFNVVSPSCLEHVLKTNHENYIKGKLVRTFDELLGKAVFTTDGEEWKFHRKIVTSVMGRDTVNYGALLLETKLKSVEEFLSEKDGETIDFQDMAHKMIFDVFMKLTFGVDLNQVGNETADPMLLEFSEAFNELQAHTHARFDDLFWEIKQRFRIGQREKRVRNCMAVIDQFAYSVIEKTKQTKILNDRKDVVSRFVQYARDKRGHDPTNKELRDFVMTFVMAGRDTTAAALTWTVWELTRHPGYIDLIREEVDDTSKDLFSVESTRKLPITSAVVMESLRLHPTAPESFRFARKSDTLPDGTFIPAGSLVMFSPYSITHNESVWGSEVDSFDPNRWLKTKEPTPFNFPAFSAGPRACPGRSLALMELRMALAFLVSRFDFLDVAMHDGSYSFALVMKMRNGFPVTIRRR